MVLDLGLPNMSGESVFKEVRKKFPDLPIIILTAKDSVEDKVQALDAGADDYLTKPFSLDELLARVRALLRRPHDVLPDDITCGDIALNLTTRKVSRAGKDIPLTLKEFSILEYFMRHPNQVLTRDQILDHVWDYNFSSLSNIMDVHITNLRKKLRGKKKETLIQTVRGVGYRFKI